MHFKIRYGFHISNDIIILTSFRHSVNWGTKQNNKVKKLCQKLLKQKEGLSFEFQWVYFKNLPQYMIPFGAVLGTILLVLIAGTVWDCCCHNDERKRYTKKGTCFSELGNEKI